MSQPNWSLRAATYDDAPTLASIVIEATKQQGLWPGFTGTEEQEWRDGFADWTRESIDGTDQLDMIMVDDQPIGRLRIERDELEIEGRHVPRVTLCGLQLRPACQRQGIGTAIVRQLQAEARAASGVMDLGVEHANSGARRLYDRLGFVPIGRDDQEVQMRWTP